MMDPRLKAAMTRCPLVAILRGVRPEEVEAIGRVLIDAGFSLIEVPLNSPDPFDSIARLARLEGALVGAGTILDPGEVDRLAAAGGVLAVSPHCDPAVIAATKRLGLISIPGIATPTEAFAALKAGADALKLFPAEGASPTVLKAMRAVLPKETAVLPVGGIAPDNMGPWRAAGAAGFGLGSALYKPGDSAEAVAAQARKFLAALA
ncbi:MAG: 2-dehydro-3-deoxy-6-phosphogalactonate aldolase [Elsteraceae bacterium]